MNYDEFEKKLAEHSRKLRDHTASPFDIGHIIEKEDINHMKKNIKLRSAILTAAILCIFATTAFAAYNHLNAKQAAESLGNKKLAETFSENEYSYGPVADGKYKASILGITSGENISSFNSSSTYLNPERTYAVIAVEKTDGSKMTYDDELLVTPLIEGLEPWKYNIYTMNGGYSANITDGILYRIIEFDSIEYFSDRQVYIAVLDKSFFDKNAYVFNEETGLISENQAYNGTNILFELNLDKNKADPKKAKEYTEAVNSKFKNN